MMRMIESELSISAPDAGGPISGLERAVLGTVPPDETPVRSVVARSDSHSWHCGLGVLADAPGPSDRALAGRFLAPLRRTVPAPAFALNLPPSMIRWPRRCLKGAHQAD